MTAIQLLVGLGNPGATYTHTRHNVGFWFLEQLPQATPFKAEARWKGAVATLQLESHKCRLFMPMTYMNLSGEAVQAISRFYHIEPEAILVVHDDMDLPAGTIRLKRGVGHAGHNGLRSIEAHLHSKQFVRLRIGIGHPGNKEAVLHYVLHAPSREEVLQIQAACTRARAVLPLLITGQFEKAMTQLHTETH